MKIKRYYMEDWLNDSAHVSCNLSASGCQDFRLEELLQHCQTDIRSFNQIFLGDNDTRGSLRLREQICQSYQHVNVDNVLATNGSSEGLFAFFNELLEAGDEVVVPFPAFQCLYQIPISIGCRMAYLPLLESKQWKLDLGRLDSLVTPDTKLLIINTPHNPIGWTLSVDELTAIAEIARKNDCYLLFDEHYRYLPLIKEMKLIPSGYDVCRRIHDKTYASGSMIKCFGIVGIRIGWLLGDPEMLSRCRDYKDYLTHTIPEITDYLAYLALRHTDTIIMAHKANILPNLSRLNEFMERHADVFEYMEPTGGVVCFPKLKDGRDVRGFCQTLLQKYDVSILPGFAFEVEEHVRLNFGVKSGIFETALDRIQLCVKQEQLS